MKIKHLEPFGTPLKSRLFGLPIWLHVFVFIFQFKDLDVCLPLQMNSSPSSPSSGFERLTRLDQVNRFPYLGRCIGFNQ